VSAFARLPPPYVLKAVYRSGLVRRQGRSVILRSACSENRHPARIKSGPSFFGPRSDRRVAGLRLDGDATLRDHSSKTKREGVGLKLCLTQLINAQQALALWLEDEAVASFRDISDLMNDPEVKEAMKDGGTLLAVPLIALTSY